MSHSLLNIIIITSASKKVGFYKSSYGNDILVKHTLPPSQNI